MVQQQLTCVVRAIFTANKQVIILQYSTRSVLMAFRWLQYVEACFPLFYVADGGGGG